ncbi:MAG: DUF2148 domain-containing protein [Oscillospiraceae bacterium]|nr:DUF2148 domain-containing protein [Oscillospiraceae bacterium]
MEYGIEKNGVRTVAELAALAARTAPKSHGVDHFSIALASKEEIAAISARMVEIGKEKEAELMAKGEKWETKAKATALDWKSDADCVGASDEILLIGLDGRKMVVKNCGLCGFETCAEFLKHPRVSKPHWEGPFCTNLMVDVGIAVSSAASVLVRHHVDNRMFFKVGLAARDLGLMPECNCVIAMAMAASGKNKYFDRLEKLQAVAMQRGLGSY